MKSIWRLIYTSIFLHVSSQLDAGYIIFIGILQKLEMITVSVVHNNMGWQFGLGSAGRLCLVWPHSYFCHHLPRRLGLTNLGWPQLKWLVSSPNGHSSSISWSEFAHMAAGQSFKIVSGNVKDAWDSGLEPAQPHFHHNVLVIANYKTKLPWRCGKFISSFDGRSCKVRCQNMWV